MRRRHAISPLIGWLAAATSAPGQSPPPAPDNPDEILARVIEAYRSEPFAERIVLRAESTGTGARSSRITVFGAHRAERGPGARLELGELIVHAEFGLARAWRRAAVSRRAERHEPGAEPIQILSEFIPPVPVPQLGAVLSDGPIAPWDVPFGPGLGWTVRSAASRPVPTIDIESPDGPTVARLRLRWPSCRIDSFELVTERGRLQGACTPVEPGDPAHWADDVPGGEVVRSAAELVPAESLLREGDLFADIVVSDAKYEPISLERVALRPSSSFDARRRVAVIVTREFHSAMSRKDAVELVAGAIADAERLMGGDDVRHGPVITLTAVEMISIELATREAAAAMERDWVALGAGAGRSVRAYWTSRGSVGIDRMVPGAQAGAIVMTEGPTFEGAVDFADRAGARQALAAIIARAGR